MAEGKILPYLDMPLQHASPTVLKRMRRPGNQERQLERIRRWRETCPDLAIRSTFIVGFPGETEAEFSELLDWIKEAKLERVGCFTYEPVTGALANSVGEAVPPELQLERKRRFMEAQQQVSLRLQKARIGKRIPVIIDTVGADGIKGRSKYDAPEIDGSVHVTSRRPVRQGDIVTVKIEAADAYDLRGSVV
jgi:ribosomal protein S12 methylthiotransferase